MPRRPRITLAGVPLHLIQRGKASIENYFVSLRVGSGPDGVNLQDYEQQLRTRKRTLPERDCCRTRLPRISWQNGKTLQA